MGRPGRQRAPKSPYATPQSPTPIGPRVQGALTPVTDIDELIADPQWSRCEVTVDMTGSTIDKADISECRIIGSRLVRLDLEGARVIDTVFQDCDLSGTSLQDATLSRVAFVNCRMSGLILNAGRLRDVRLTDCKADQMSLRMAIAERLTCERVLLTTADFYEAKLTLTRLFDCDLSEAEFSKVTLDDVRLHGSNLAALRGIEYMRGAAIDPDQMHDFAAALLAANRITVDGEREPIRP